MSLPSNVSNDGDDGNDGDAQRRYREARRRAIRANHPDAGGDAAALQAALDKLERRQSVNRRSVNPIVAVSKSPRRRIMRRLRTRLRRRRYTEI